MSVLHLASHTRILKERLSDKDTRPTSQLRVHSSINVHVQQLNVEWSLAAHYTHPAHIAKIKTNCSLA